MTLLCIIFLHNIKNHTSIFRITRWMMNISAHCVQFHLSSVHGGRWATAAKGRDLDVCRVHFIFPVSDTHLATVNEALIALLIIVMAL